ADREYTDSRRILFYQFSGKNSYRKVMSSLQKHADPEIVVFGNSSQQGTYFQDSVGQKIKRSGNFCFQQRNHCAGDSLLPHQMAPENMGWNSSRIEGFTQSDLELPNVILKRKYATVAKIREEDEEGTNSVENTTGMSTGGLMTMMLAVPDENK
ncbi:hypothetical protein Tco_1382128, partial [Tanacetum coccineum]